MAVPRIRSKDELHRLTPRQVAVLQQIAAGKTHADAARALGIATGTLNRCLTEAGYRLGRGSDPARVHAALSTGQVQVPLPTWDPPDLEPDDLVLLRALARFSDRDLIAAEAALASAELAPRLADLCSKTGAAHAAHLVALGHAWHLVPPAADLLVASPPRGKTR